MSIACLYALVWQSTLRCANLWLVLWTRISRILAHWTEQISWLISMTRTGDLMNQNYQWTDSMSPITQKSVKMVAELRDGTALWIFDTPKWDTFCGECNMTEEQQAATPQASSVAQRPPFTVEQQSFIEEFMRVQHQNHEAAIHQLQASHAEELRTIRQEAEDARRTEHMRSRMDLKVGKPDVRNPDKTPSLEWDHKWRAYMGMCSTTILSDLQNIRENPKRILIYSDLDTTKQQDSNEVYFSLVMLTTGKAATIVRTVRDNNGYEAYQLLRQRFEPENYGKHLTSLTQILKFDFGSNPSEFLDRLIEWEGLIDKYEQETLETISKNLLCAIVVEKAPEAIRMHLLVQCGERPDWLKLRQTVHDYCYSKIPGPVAMDVGAITKGWGKGKRKDKNESQGDGGKSKRGKKGKHAKQAEKQNAEKSKDHDKFDGYCGCCGKWGHKQKDCWHNKRSHQVNHLSDGQAASCSAPRQPPPPPHDASLQTASVGAITHCGLEEGKDGWVFGVEDHESAISDQFVGATELSNHGKPGTRIELMVESGSAATVCGPEHFCDTPVTAGPPMRLRASNGQPLKHYGQKKVELLSDGGEKMHVTCSVHDVKRAIISTSATAPCGIETHLDEWNPQKGRTVSYFKKRTSGGHGG